MPFILTFGIYEPLCEFTEKGLALPFPGIADLGAATLRDWQLVERLYADIEPCRGGTVNGVLYKVTEPVLGILDHGEGVPCIYNRETVTVERGGAAYEAVAYVMTQEARLRWAKRRYAEEYRNYCSFGARSHGVPDAFSRGGQRDGENED